MPSDCASADELFVAAAEIQQDGIEPARAGRRHRPKHGLRILLVADATRQDDEEVVEREDRAGGEAPSARRPSPGGTC